MLGWLIFALVVITGNAQAPSLPIEIGGTYTTALGDLSLLEGSRSLAFTYLAVFGPTAHICDGAGVASEEEPGRFVWRDDSGSVTFMVDGDSLRMKVGGLVSFCGQGWVGDTAAVTARQAPHRRAVASDRAYFHTLGPDMPQPRRAYVVRGDTVDVVPVFHGTGEGFVLGRFTGPEHTTVGLLKEEDLVPSLPLSPLDCDKGPSALPEGEATAR